MLLLMTVEPGFGGQKFLDLCLPKIRRARELISAAGLEVWLQVDGGVSLETIERCAEAGADVFVAGSAVFSAERPGRDGRAAAGHGDRPQRQVADDRPRRSRSGPRERSHTLSLRPMWQACPTSYELACSGIGATPSRR